MNENENKIFPSSHLLRKVFKGIFSSLLSDDGDGRFLADEDFWERLMVSSFMLFGDCKVRFLMRRSAGGQPLLHAPCLNLIVGLGVSLIRPILESVWSLVV